MKKRTLIALGISIIMLLSGCADGAETTTENETTVVDESLHATVSTVALTEGKYSEEKLDDTWDDTATEILFEDNTATATSDRVSVADNVITINKEGTYVLTGTLDDGQVIVDVANKGNVKLVFNGISLTCTSTAPLYIKEGTVVITLAPDTENTITDGQEYTYEDGEDEPKAAIFSKDDLTFNGTGTLNVTGNYNNGIQCKDDLKFVSGTYHITAVNNTIVGKDSVSVKNGDFTLEAGGDGIKTTNIDETDKGYILIEDGTFAITAEADGIQTETLLRINDGDFDIVTGGGSQEAVQYDEIPESRNMSGGQMPGGGVGKRGQTRDGKMPQDGEIPQNGETPQNDEIPQNGKTPQDDEIPQNGKAPQDGEPPQDVEAPQASANTEDSTETESMKGLKSYVDLIIAGGTFNLDACDDGVHSNQNVTVEGGTLTTQAGDDGIHADQKLTINGGDIDIQKSYEGLEGMEIEINDGDVKVIASDDGINAAGDDDSAANPEDTEELNTAPAITNRGNSGDQGAFLTVNGGNVYVNANGDGLDANGGIYINGGTVVVHGPTDGGNGTLDYASECKITSGTFLADGSAGMAQNPSDTSTQPVITYSLSDTVDTGTTVSLTDTSGNILTEYTTEKATQWFTLSTPDLKGGATYTLQIGDDNTEVTAN